MRLAIHHRLVALLVLGSLFLWNAPAMAFPALLQQMGQCEIAPAKAAAAPMAQMHHPGMHHHGGMTMAMPTTPVEGVSMAQCISEHACCTWNREPAKKNEHFSLSGAQAGSAALERSSAHPHRHADASSLLSLFVKPVFQMKADLRI